MGEYAKYRGQRIKIGTCENMYYLRHDQRFQVQAEPGNVDPASEDQYALRFRFPWPSEDHVEPGGNFEPFERTCAVPGFTAPAAADHHSVQFVAQNGYNVCLPCPESAEYAEPVPTASGALNLNDPTGRPVTPPIRVFRNGFKGSVLLAYQKPVRGIGLVPVLMCGGCGAMWREEDRHEIEKIALAFRSEGDRRERDGERNGTGKADRAFYDQIADRILAGLNPAELDPEPIDMDPETGEKQPRLPDDVGQVRDQEHAQPPVADVPEGFSLRPPAETEPTQTNLLRFVAGGGR